jgi:sensor histidine kinase YesM
MIILGISYGIASKYIYNAAINSVKVAQNAIIELDKDESRHAAISLSHVVNMNNGSTIMQAAGTDELKKETALIQLDTMYQLLAAPEYKLLDIQVYRKDGISIIPRCQIRYSMEELRRKEWYQSALQQPGQVYVAMDDKDYFYRSQTANEVMVVAAIFPRNMPEVECIALYKLSKIPEMIKKYNKDGSTGQMYIIDANGISLTKDLEETAVPEYILEKIHKNHAGEMKISYKGICYIIQEMADSDRYILSAVDEWNVFGQFRLVSLVSLLVVFSVILLFIVYFKWYMDRLLIPLHQLTEGMKEVENHNLEVQVEMCGQKDIAQMISVFNSMVDKISQLIVEKEVAQKEKYQEELLALQSQMNPHFLMNTLNTLKFMAISAHFDGMRDMVTALENILDAILNRDGGFHSVSDEKSILDSYIYIMQFRYMESFNVETDISQEALNCKVPKLILQPIVENSMIHGFDQMDERQGIIRIKGYVQDNTLVFEIIDNGKGMNQETISKIRKEKPESAGRRTVGVSNTDRRLKLNFGSQYGVEIESEQEQYTRVRLTMPVIKAEDDSHV